MTVSPLNVNQCWSTLRGTGANLVSGTRQGTINVRIGSTTTPPLGDDGSLTKAYSDASFLARGVAVDIAWSLATQKSGGAGSDNANLGGGVWVFEDNQDGGGLGTSAVAYIDLAPQASRNFGTLAVIASGTTTWTPTKSGSYKFVAVLYSLSGLTVNAATPPTTGRVRNTATTGETDCYLDADGYTAFSNGGLDDPALKVITTTRAVGWVRVATDPQTLSASIATPLVYPNQPTVSLDACASSFAGANTKQMRVGFAVTTNADRTLWTAPASSVAPIKIVTLTMTVNGASVTGAAQNIDTDFNALLKKHRLRAWVGPKGGQSSTLAGEKPDVLTQASVTLSLVDTNDQAWTTFASSGLGSGISQLDSFSVENTNNFDIGSGITIYKEAAKTNLGAKSWGSSAYTTAEDLFRRLCANAADGVGAHATPYLEAYAVDANGGLIDNKSFLCKVITQGSSPAEENSQAITTGTGGTVGRLRWNYNIATTHGAFNRFIKLAAARVTGGHVATGPDDPTSPPATFGAANKSGSDKTGTYPNPLTGGTGTRLSYDGPYPAYPKTVRVTGNAFSGTKEPTVDAASVFGVNSEWVFEDIITVNNNDKISDGTTSAPTGINRRSKTLGSGSLYAKLCSEINESSGLLLSTTEDSGSDVAGRLWVYTGTFKGRCRRALMDSVTNIVSDSGTSTGANGELAGPNGYQSGSSSFDQIATPSDPTTLRYYQSCAATTTERDLFTLTATTDVGFTTDAENVGFTFVIVQFIEVNPNYLVIATVENLLYAPGVTTVRVKVQFREILPNGDIVEALVDPSAGIYISRDPGGTSAINDLITNAAMTAIAPNGAGKSANWYYDYTTPVNGTYSATISGIINSGRPTGPGKVEFIVGEPDPDISLILDVGHSGDTHNGKHLIAGLPIEVNIIALRESTGALIDLDTGASQPKFALFRKNLTEYLASDFTWKNAISQAPVFFHSPTLNASEKRWTTAFVTDSTWGVSDVIAVGKAQYLGATYEGEQFREFTGARFQHDRLTDTYGARVTTDGNNIVLSGLQTIDGVTLVAGDRVLVMGQTTAADNGLYVVASGAWTREETFTAAVGVKSSTQVRIQEGTIFGRSVWSLVTPNPITVGTTPLTFEITSIDSDLSMQIAAGSTRIGGHFQPGDSLGAVLWMYDQIAKQMIPVTNPVFIIQRVTNGRIQYLNAAQTAWVDLTGAAVADEHAAVETVVGTSRLYSKVFATTPGLWSQRDVQIKAKGSVGGVPYSADTSVSSVASDATHQRVINLVGGAGPVGAAIGTHWTVGTSLVVGGSLFDTQQSTVVPPDVSPAPYFSAFRLNQATGRAQYLKSDYTWADVPTAAELAATTASAVQVLDSTVTVINVADTSAFAASGKLLLAYQGSAFGEATYTGKTATSFTGVVILKAGVLSSGGAVTQDFDATAFAMTVSASDSRVYTGVITSGQASVANGWTTDDIFFVIHFTMNGRDYVSTVQLGVVSTKFKHDTNEPEASITFDTVSGHHHIGSDSRAIGDRS